MSRMEYGRTGLTRAGRLYERLLERLAVAAIGRCQAGLATPEQWAKEVSAMAYALASRSMEDLGEVKRHRPTTPEEIRKFLQDLELPSQGASQ